MLGWAGTCGIVAKLTGTTGGIDHMVKDSQ